MRLVQSQCDGKAVMKWFEVIGNRWIITLYAVNGQNGMTSTQIIGEMGVNADSNMNLNILCDFVFDEMISSLSTVNGNTWSGDTMYYFATTGVDSKAPTDSVYGSNAKMGLFWIWIFKKKTASNRMSTLFILVFFVFSLFCHLRVHTAFVCWVHFDIYNDNRFDDAM